jgi:adenosylmethionine-8-amino-7-oxononanoate aminotransferase
LACAAALASLDLFESENILERIKPVIATLAEKLASIAELDHVGEVRQRGMMIGMELVQDRSTKAEYPYGERVGHRVCLAARKRGVLLRPLGNVVVLMPPLSVTVAEAEWLGEVVKDSIDEVTSH